MRIENLRSEKKDNRARVAATVIWENYAHKAQEIYFETVEEFGDALSCGPHAFLVACTMPAMYFGEERVLIDGEICPELRDGLMTSMVWFRHWWYTPERKLVQIEGATRSNGSGPRKQERAGFFLSGGIDSLATLRANRLHYPLQDPGSIKDALLVYGLEVREPNIFDYVMNSVSVLAKDAALTLIPVYTNIRCLGPDDDMQFWGKFWINEFMGAAFAAIAHALSNRLTLVSINSCHDIPNIIPYSSHPLVNPNYTSSDLRIRHWGITLSRFAKTKLISDWDVAIQHLRVCNRTEYYRPGMLNCGKCEKCVRTMLALVACGVLGKTHAFPVQDVSEELVMAAVHLAANTFPLYGELIAPLAEKGRHDLARAIEQKIASYHRSEERKRRRKALIDPIVEFDEKNLGGALRKLKRLVYPKGVWTSS
jgi:hypothetical protein